MQRASRIFVNLNLESVIVVDGFEIDQSFKLMHGALV